MEIFVPFLSKIKFKVFFFENNAYYKNMEGVIKVSTIYAMVK
jgi:hypothetical protein